MAAGIDVDGRERLGLVDDDLAAARERDATLEELLDLALDVVAFEDRDGVGVQLDPRAGAWRHLTDEVLDQLEVLGVVHEDAVHFFRQEVADGALDQAGLLVEQDRLAVRGVDLLDDGLPALEQHVQVADEPAGLLAFAGGADDDAHAFRDGQGAQDILEAFALGGFLDLAGDAARAAEGHQHEVTAGQSDIGRRARTLGADLILDDLDDDVGAGREELRDVLRLIAGLALLLLGGFVVADELDLRVIGGREHVPVMEERVLRLTDVHEGGLEASFEVLDAALEDRADHAVLALVLDLELVEDAVGEERDALLQRLGVDHELSVDRAVLGEVFDDALEQRELLAPLRRLVGQLALVDRGGLFAALGQLVVDIFGFVIIGHLGQAVKPVAGEPPPSPPPAECR